MLGAPIGETPPTGCPPPRVAIPSHHAWGRKNRARRAVLRRAAQALTRSLDFVHKDQPAQALDALQEASPPGENTLADQALWLALRVAHESLKPWLERSALPAAKAPVRPLAWGLALVPILSAASACLVLGMWLASPGWDAPAAAAPASPALWGGLFVTPTSSLTPTATATLPPPTETPAPRPTPLPTLLQIGTSNLDLVRELFAWPAGEEMISLSFSPDGAKIASGDQAGIVRVWMVWQDEPLYEIPGAYAAFSRDGRYLAVAGPGGLALHNPSDGRLERWINQERPYYSVLFSADSRTLAAGANNTRFYTFNVNDGSENMPGGGFSNPVHSLSFSSDGRLLAVASNETTYVWNYQLQKVERNMPPRKEQPIYFSATIDPDGEWFATGQKDGQVYIWRVSNGERMASFNDKSRFVYGLQFLNQSDYPEILVTGDEVNLSFWQMYGYDTTLRNSIFSSAPIRSLTVAIGDRMIATGHSDGVIRLWGIMP